MLTTCVHHWICDAPRGPGVRSWCKLCGAERTFRASPGTVELSATEIVAIKRTRKLESVIASAEFHLTAGAYSADRLCHESQRRTRYYLAARQ